MIPVRENSEVVIIYPDLCKICPVAMFLGKKLASMICVNALPSGYD